jgi:hypothetical protein
MKRMTQTDWAYMAGTIDSDGCIGSQKNTNCATYRPYLVVIQKDMRLIEWLFNKFEGSVNIVGRKHPDRTDWYVRWMVVNSRVAAILKECIPYLIVKKEQALLAVEMVDKTFSGRLQGRKGLPSELIARQKGLYESIKLLNSPATTESFGSLTKEMRQSELTEMKNRQRGDRSILSAN